MSRPIRNHHLPTVLFLMAGIALGCATDDKGETGDSNADGEAIWSVSDLALAPDGLNYAEVTGKVTLEGDAGSFPGTTAHVRYYQDDYETLLDETTSTIGDDLDTSGTTEAFSITSLYVYMLPALDGQEYVCATFQAEDSDVADWTELGCLTGTSN